MYWFLYLINNNAVRECWHYTMIFCQQRSFAAHNQLPMLCQELRAITFLFNIKHLGFCCKITLLHNCVECDEKTCTSKIHKMTDLCYGVMVDYKNNLQVMLQYLICTAQVERLNYSYTCLVGLATVLCSLELIRQSNASVT